MEIYRDETGRYYAFCSETCELRVLQSAGYSDAQEEADSLYGTKNFVEILDTDAETQYNID